MAVALPKPQLGGFLLLKIRNVNKHEEQTFFHWFSAIAEVAQLDHVRVYIRKLGTAAKAVANRRKLAIEFTGSAFEPDAVAFFVSTRFASVMGHWPRPALVRRLKIGPGRGRSKPAPANHRRWC